MAFHRADPSTPDVVFTIHYDDASGERTELSTVTLANWAAKTANLLRASVVSPPVGGRVNTRDNTPAVIHTRLVPGNTLNRQPGDRRKPLTPPLPVSSPGPPNA